MRKNCSKVLAKSIAGQRDWFKSGDQLEERKTGRRDLRNKSIDNLNWGALFQVNLIVVKASFRLIHKCRLDDANLLMDLNRFS